MENCFNIKRPNLSRFNNSRPSRKRTGAAFMGRLDANGCEPVATATRGNGSPAFLHRRVSHSDAIGCRQLRSGPQPMGQSHWSERGVFFIYFFYIFFLLSDIFPVVSCSLTRPPLVFGAHFLFDLCSSASRQPGKVEALGLFLARQTKLITVAGREHAPSRKRCSDCWNPVRGELDVKYHVFTYFSVTFLWAHYSVLKRLSDMLAVSRGCNTKIRKLIMCSQATHRKLALL